MTSFFDDIVFNEISILGFGRKKKLKPAIQQKELSLEEKKKIYKKAKAIFSANISKLKQKHPNLKNSIKLIRYDDPDDLEIELDNTHIDFLDVDGSHYSNDPSKQDFMDILYELCKIIDTEINPDDGYLDPEIDHHAIGSVYIYFG